MSAKIRKSFYNIKKNNFKKIIIYYEKALKIN